jgi:hypothetical protein
VQATASSGVGRPQVAADTRTLAEQLRDMLQILEGTDQLFWAQSWNIHIEKEVPGEDREVSIL